MLTQQQARELIGQELQADNGDRVGTIGQVYLDDETGQPEWVTVHTGLFGSKETFVPLAHASIHTSGPEEEAHLVLSVPYEKQKIKDAPAIDVDSGKLTREEEALLYEYYELTYVLTSAQVQPLADAAAAPSRSPMPPLVATPAATGVGHSASASGAAIPAALASTPSPAPAHPMTREERTHPVLSRVGGGRTKRLRRLIGVHTNDSDEVPAVPGAGS